MKMRTLQQRYLAALLARGEKQVQGRSQRYLTVTRGAGAGGFYYLGKAGSLRFGRTVTGSVPCPDTFKEALLKEPLQAKIPPKVVEITKEKLLTLLGAQKGPSDE